MARLAALLVRLGKVVKQRLKLGLRVVTNAIQTWGFAATVFIAIPRSKNLFPKFPLLASHADIVWDNQLIWTRANKGKRNVPFASADFRGEEDCATSPKDVCVGGMIALSPPPSSQAFYFKFASRLQWIKEREINMFRVVLFHRAHTVVFFLDMKKIHFKHLIAS